MTYQTCGEISCEECNDRYEKALARIAELEQMVAKHKAADEALTARLKVDDAYTDELEQMVLELVNTVVQIPTEECVTLSVKALALLQPEAGKEMGK